MFENSTVTVVKNVQIPWAIGRTSGMEDHVVSTGHGVDRIDLNEPKLINDGLQIAALARPGRRLTQPMPIQEDRPRLLMIDTW